MIPRLIAITMSLLGCMAGPIDVADLAPTGLRMGVLALWPLDDGVGVMAADRSVSARHGTVSGGSWITGRFGGALHFDVGTEIMVPSFPPATRDWSVALWVRPPASDLVDTFVTLISTENVFLGGWEMNLRLVPTDTRYQFGYFVGPGESDYLTFDCACVVAQQWTHIASVVDSTAGTMSFYKDGIYQGMTRISQPIKPGNPTLYMGRWQMPGRLFTGDLDDVVIYSRALAAPEVLALAKAAVPIPR